MSLERALVELGLNETEARFYLAALELGQAPVREVAQKAGISRTNAYDVCTRLAEHGLIAQTPRAPGQSMLVVAERPEHLVELIEQRRKRALEVLPELRSLHNTSRSKPRVRYFEGPEGIKSVLDDTLECADKRVCGILSMRDLYEVPGREWMDDFVRRRIAGGIFLRAIRSAETEVHDLWQTSAADLRESRYAPADFMFTMTTYIYDDHVAVISSRRENFAMTIQSAEFAMMQRNLFNALWAASQPLARVRRSARRRTAVADAQR